MQDRDWLAQQFEARRNHLHSVAYRMLGSSAEADDAVQEAWLRLSRSDTGAIDNLNGWLNMVVGRVCIDLLRSRQTRREDPLEDSEVEDVADDPERAALLADSVGLAVLVVLESLGPSERLAFVLHDMFAVPFDEIASIVGCSPVAARQLASRARRKVRGSDPVPHAEITAQKQAVETFLAAVRSGDFEALVAVLDPDVVIRTDIGPEVRGARVVAGNAIQFAHMANAAQLALVDGGVGLVAWLPPGQPFSVMRFMVHDDRIVEMDVIRDPGRLRELCLVRLD